MLLSRRSASHAAPAVARLAQRSSAVAVRASARHLTTLNAPATRPAATLTSSIPTTLSAAIVARRGFRTSAPAHADEVVKVPQMAESLSEGTLKQWSKKKGDFVKADEEVAVIETDKIDVTVNAPVSGTISETMANEEDTVTVGQDLFKLTPGDGPAEGASSSDEGSSSSKKEEDKEAAPQEDAKDKEHEAKKGEEPKPQPTKEAKDKNDAPAPPKQDKPAAKESKPAASSSSSSSSSSSAPAPATRGSREERRVKMSRMRLRIAERLKQSQNTAASLTTFNEIDMTSLIEFRARHKDRILKESGIKLGFMGAFAKASALALKEIPAANASIEGEGLGDTIVYRDYVDLSVAVSTDKGLVTPVVRNIEDMSILDIERGIAEMGKKARDGKLTLEDMSGGTFTISNGGVFGSLFGTPILNLPGSAILGLHAVKQQPYVVNGKVEVRPVMVVALTYDHRLLDGREAVTTLVRIKEYIEDLGRMLL